MATLAGQLIKDSYKDLLTIAGSTPNQGIESAAKQIFDGEGVASALWVSTNLLQVGSTSTTASIDIHGAMTSKEIKLRDSNNTIHDILGVSTGGLLELKTDLATKGSVTFTKVGYDDIVMDAQGSAMKRGDGTKGNVKLGDTSVSLQKGSTDLLEIKEDGTLMLKNVSSLPSSPDAGDIVNYNGALWINL